MDQSTIMLLEELLFTIIWALVGALSMGISLGLLIKFFDWMTPVNEWNQIKNGNLAMGIVLGAVILAFGMVIACTLIPSKLKFTVELVQPPPAVAASVVTPVN